jgi:hypothetical protein
LWPRQPERCLALLGLDLNVLISLLPFALVLVAFGVDLLRIIATL